MKKTLLIMHWAPRVICILAISFVSLFALDAFDHGDNLWQQLLDFFMHLIPSFVLIILLAVAWKWELIGGVIFAIIGLGLTPFIFYHNYQMNGSFWVSFGVIMSITFPFVVVGILFIISHFLKKKNPEAVS